MGTESFDLLLKLKSAERQAIVDRANVQDYRNVDESGSEVVNQAFEKFRNMTVEVASASSIDELSKLHEELRKRREDEGFAEVYDRFERKFDELVQIRSTNGNFDLNNPYKKLTHMVQYCKF